MKNETTLTYRTGILRNHNCQKSLILPRYKQINNLFRLEIDVFSDNVYGIPVLLVCQRMKVNRPDNFTINNFKRKYTSPDSKGEDCANFLKA